MRNWKKEERVSPDIEGVGGDDERVSPDIVVGWVLFVVVVWGEEERGEGGDEICDDQDGEQRDIEAGGGGEGGEIRCEEERDERPDLKMKN